MIFYECQIAGTAVNTMHLQPVLSQRGRRKENLIFLTDTAKGYLTFCSAFHHLRDPELLMKQFLQEQNLNGNILSQRELFAGELAQRLYCAEAARLLESHQQVLEYLRLDSYTNPQVNPAISEMRCNLSDGCREPAITKALREIDKNRPASFLSFCIVAKSIQSAEKDLETVIGILSSAQALDTGRICGISPDQQQLPYEELYKLYTSQHGGTILMTSLILPLSAKKKPVCAGFWTM